MTQEQSSGPSKHSVELPADDIVFDNQRRVAVIVNQEFVEAIYQAVSQPTGAGDKGGKVTLTYEWTN
jgi:hypothetical protein